MTVGTTVYVPPIFTRRRPYQFHVKQLRFLHFFEQSRDLEKACEEAGCTVAFAKKFLKSEDWREFAAEALQDQAIHDGWNPRRVIVELDAIYRGERMVSETQFDALKEMRQILMPRKAESAVSGGVTVNLNFPVLPADVQARLKALADEAAVIDVDAA